MFRLSPSCWQYGETARRQGDQRVIISDSPIPTGTVNVGGGGWGVWLRSGALGKGVHVEGKEQGPQEDLRPRGGCVSG